MKQSFFTIAQQNSAAGKVVQPSAETGTGSTAQVPDSENIPSSGETRSADGFGSMIPFFIIMAVMIYFMFRKQKKEQKQRQEMIESVKAGDKVLTIGGIYGEIVTVKEQSFIVKIADNTRIEIMKSAVSSMPAGEEAKK